MQMNTCMYGGTYASFVSGVYCMFVFISFYVYR